MLSLLCSVSIFRVHIQYNNKESFKRHVDTFQAWKKLGAIYMKHFRGLPVPQHEFDKSNLPLCTFDIIL